MVEYFYELLRGIKENLKLLDIIIIECDICKQIRYCRYDPLEKKRICYKCTKKGDQNRFFP